MNDLVWKTVIFYVQCSQCSRFFFYRSKTVFLIDCNSYCYWHKQITQLVPMRSMEQLIIFFSANTNDASFGGGSGMYEISMYIVWTKMYYWGNYLVFKSPPGLTFTWSGCQGLCPWHKPTELAHSFYSVLMSVSVFMKHTISTIFHSINSPNSSLLSHYVLPALFLPYWSFLGTKKKKKNRHDFF